MADAFKEQRIANIETQEDVNELLTSLSKSYNDLRDAITSFPFGNENQVLFGEWTLKDLVGHFSAWNELTVSDLEKFIDGKDINNWIQDNQCDQFNRREVEKRKHLNWDVVLVEFVYTSLRLINTYKRLELDEWNSQFGPGEDSTPLRSILIDIDHMGPDHILEILDVLQKVRENEQ